MIEAGRSSEARGIECEFKEVFWLICERSEEPIVPVFCGGAVVVMCATAARVKVQDVKLHRGVCVCVC